MVARHLATSNSLTSINIGTTKEATHTLKQPETSWI